MQFQTYTKIMIIFIHTTMCRDRQTERPEKTIQSIQQSKYKSTKNVPRDCPHTEYTEHSLLNS